MSAPVVSRRAFIATAATVTGGLVLGFALPGRLASAPGSATPFEPNAFLRIDPDGMVTVMVQRPEMGQGIRTTIAMLVAEELEADWSRVRIEQADLDPKYGTDAQYAGGSNSTPESWHPLRQAGATARAMLVSAAARRWGVAESDCRATNGTVVHGTSGRSARYGELADAARTIPVPTDVPLKPESEYRIVGRRTTHLDVPAIANGSIRFGLDVRVPGMLYASIERSPVFGGRAQRVDDSAARRVRGVRDVVVIDADAAPDFGGESPKMPNGVAVVADSTWAAMEGRKALRVTWDEGRGRAESSDGMRAAWRELAAAPPGRVGRRDGDVERALAAAATRVEATYELPFLAHATMEPMNCTAHVTAGRCEIWAPTQNPDGARAVAAAITGLPRESVTVHLERMGGGFGRRFYADFVGEAVIVSRAVRAPVQVVWSREDDMRHGFYRPSGMHVMRAGLDASGNVTAWSRRVISAERGRYLGWRLPRGATSYPAGMGEIGEFDFPAGFIPNFQLEASTVDSMVPRGQWRAIEESTNVFAVQCFLDEVAHAARRDVLALHLDLLGPPRDVKYYDETYSTGRLAAVLRLAAQRSGWGTPLPAGWGRGIAACFANGSYTAEVAEVEVAASGKVRVHRVVVAIDCGRVINPSGADAQIEGSIVYGISAALGQQITVERGRVVQRNFTDYPLLRIDEMPRIEIHYIEGEPNPLGLGEPALPAAAPAVANAIFAATGRRVRRLPISG